MTSWLRNSRLSERAVLIVLVGSLTVRCGGRADSGSVAAPSPRDGAAETHPWSDAATAVDGRLDAPSDAVADGDAPPDALACKNGPQPFDFTLPAPCAGCLGIACDLGRTCSYSYHSGGPASVRCECARGHMACCGFSGSTGSCTYGGEPAPDCPASTPKQGAPCDVLQVCAYADACCPSFSMACMQGAWYQLVPLTTVCTPCASDAAVDAPASD